MSASPSPVLSGFPRLATILLLAGIGGGLAGPAPADPAPAGGTPTAAAPLVPAPSAATAPAIDPAAMDQLLRMARFLAAQQTWSVSIRVGYDAVQPDGQKLEFGERRELLVARPDRLRVDSLASDGDQRVITFDGQSVVVLDPVRKLYATAPMSGSLDATVPAFLRDLHMRLPLALLVVSSLPGDLERRVRAARIVEVEQSTGKPYVQVAARGDAVDLQVWIPQDGEPLPRRLVLTYRDEEGQPQFRADFADWNLAPTVTAERFAPAVPADAHRIAFLSQVAPATPAVDETPTTGAKP